MPGSRIPVAESSLHGCRVNLFSGLFLPLGCRISALSELARVLCDRVRSRLPVIRFATHDGKRPVDLFQENQTRDLVWKSKGRKRQTPVGAPDNPGGQTGWTANDERDSTKPFQADFLDAPGEAIRIARLSIRIQGDQKCVSRKAPENAFAFPAKAIGSGALAWRGFLSDFDMLQAGVSPDTTDVVRHPFPQVRLSAFANRQQRNLHWAMIRTRSDLHKGLVPSCENGYNNLGK